MAYYTLNLSANKPYKQLAIGRVLMIDSIGASPGVDVTLVVNDSNQKTIPARRAGFKYVAQFTEVIFTSPVDCVLSVFLSKDDVDLGYVDGVQVTVQGNVGINNDNAHPIPVDVQGATINLTASNVGVNNNDVAAIPVRNQALATLSHPAPVAVGVGVTAVISDATLRVVKFRNSHATATIVLGGSTVTMANGVITLLPGDIWIERDSAGAAWYAISDVAGALLQIMGAK